MNNKSQKIALLGTSADPPTYGHQILLQGLLTLFPKVVTWASDNPIKEHRVPLTKRCSLLNALVKDIANPNLELVQDLSSPRTITSLKKASKRWSGSELIFVVGSDLTDHIPHWFQAKAVLQIARIGIVPREGWPIKKNQLDILQSLGGNVDILSLKVPATASSEIRSETQANLIPSSVLLILKKNNLYGLGGNAP